MRNIACPVAPHVSRSSGGYSVPSTPTVGSGNPKVPVPCSHRSVCIHRHGDSPGRTIRRGVAQPHELFESGDDIIRDGAAVHGICDPGVLVPAERA
jgi:hypothetical protein